MIIKDLLRSLLVLEKKYPNALARIDLEILDLENGEYSSYDFGYEEFTIADQDIVRREIANQEKYV